MGSEQQQQPEKQDVPVQPESESAESSKSQVCSTCKYHSAASVV